MKEQNNIKKRNFFKKTFVKICRVFGFEIIDQGNYDIPTLNKKLNDPLSVPGKISITIPLGQYKISRKINSLKIIFRSCTSELIMDQNKKRLFEKEKNEYTFRSLNSLLKSVTYAKKIFNKVNFEIVITDTNSDKRDIEQIKNIISKYNINNRLIEINLDDYKEKIIGNYTQAKFANMASLHLSFTLAKEENNDLIFFVEDDYIHSQNSISEMLFSYEKFSSIFKKEIFLLPADYPYLYSRNDDTKILLGQHKHWRLVNQSLLTFMTSKKIIMKKFDNLIQMTTRWEDPFEKPLHDIYKEVPCFSPIPSLSFHCANINSVYGLAPNIDWKTMWDENERY